MEKGYKFPRDRSQRKLARVRHKRWDRSLEGQKCPTCEGTSIYCDDACPRSFFSGHGFTICKNGYLQFTTYDQDNWEDLRRVYK